MSDSLDLDLLRKFADGTGGERTGALRRAGYLEVTRTPDGRAVWTVTEEGMAALAGDRFRVNEPLYAKGPFLVVDEKNDIIAKSSSREHATLLARLLNGASTVEAERKACEQIAVGLIDEVAEGRDELSDEQVAWEKAAAEIADRIRARGAR